jgi:hypothetical protein
VALLRRLRTVYESHDSLFGTAKVNSNVAPVQWTDVSLSPLRRVSTPNPAAYAAASHSSVVKVLNSSPELAVSAEAEDVSGSCFTEESCTTGLNPSPALPSPQAFRLSDELPASGANLHRSHRRRFCGDPLSLPQRRHGVNRYFQLPAVSRSPLSPRHARLARTAQGRWWGDDGERRPLNPRGRASSHPGDCLSYFAPTLQRGTYMSRHRIGIWVILCSAKALAWRDRAAYFGSEWDYVTRLGRCQAPACGGR